MDRYDFISWRQSVYKSFKRKRKAKKEIKYKGKYVFIKRLSINVLVKEGTTIEEWVEHYCTANPDMTKRLYEDFGMTIPI